VTTVTTGTSVLTDVEGVSSDVVLASEAVTEGEAVEDVVTEDALSVGKAADDVAVLESIGMGMAAENTIDEQRSIAVQRLIK